MLARPLISVFFALLLLVLLTSSSVAQEASATPTPSIERAPLTTLPANVLVAKLKSARGHSFTLSDYSGKVLVVSLWATWCGPCRFETPALVKLHKQFQPQGVQIVELSTENRKGSTVYVRKWVREFRVPYGVGWATPDVATTLMNGRDAIPQTFVISPTGRIVRRFIGFNPTKTSSQFKQAIEEALNEKPGLHEQH
jgi:thiol-disulfide isomerase/thioredoxin